MADTARLYPNDKQRKILTGFLEVGDEVGTGLEASDEVLASHVLLRGALGSGIPDPSDPLCLSYIRLICNNTQRTSVEGIAFGFLEPG